MKKVLAGLMAAALLFALVGCGAAEEKKEETGEKATVTDMVGREVVLPEKVEKVVAISAADCEILFAVGAGDKLVGRGEYCNYPPEVLDVQAVNSGAETNIEQIIALEPDLVITTAMEQNPEQIAALENAGIAVVESYAQTIEGAYQSIELIGKAVGHEEQAAAVISDMKASFESVESVVPEGESRTVYFEVSPLEYGLWTAGSGTFMDEIADMLGLENIFADVEGWAEVSEEQVLDRNPDYIVTIGMYFGEGPTPTEEIMGRSGWQNVTAVAENHVLNVDSDSLSRPGPRLADAAVELADFVTGK